MATLEQLLEKIREADSESALELLNSNPELANAHPDSVETFHGVSALHWAAHRNSVPLCQRLIELGANVNDSSGNWWRTPLAWAADAASVETVVLLLKHGAEVDQDAVMGTTALNAAAMGGSTQGSGDPNGYRRTAELLIEAGANLNGLPIRCETPLDDALRGNNQAVAEVLRQRGGKTSKS